MSIDDLEAALASLRASTESRAVSVEGTFLKPDWLLSMFCVRNAET